MPSSSALSILGALFYIAALLNGIWAIFVANENLAVVILPVAAAVSATFFGAISFAADDIRQTLRSIDSRLAAFDGNASSRE